MAGNPNLIEQYRQIHATTRYGDTSVKNLRFLRPEIRLLRPRTIIDYGCGQSKLLDQLDLGYPAELVRYDPAIPSFSRKPANPADLLINVDVLEHIEETDLDVVIGEMASMSRHAIVIVDTKPARAVLPDGRNAHVTVRPHAWWKERLLQHFSGLHQIATARTSRAGFRTWERSGFETLRYTWMRVEEDAIYYAKRIKSVATGPRRS